MACGDAHLSNFGLFASPERALLFDLNDFDEGGIAPWEWDLKRLAASIHIAGRGAGWGEQVLRDLTADAVRAYQSQLAELMERSALERFYAALPLDDIGALSIDGADRKMIQKVVDKARQRTSEQVLGKLTTTTEDGHLVIVDQPPITRHLENPDWERLRTLLNQYRATLREDVAVLLYQFEPVDVVLRVVGVGSVGTRCYVVLFTGPAGEPLFLQIKEARASVLVTYGGMPSGLPGRPDARPRCQGHRVVAAQRILQSHSDRFLGWLTAPLTDRSRDAGDFYWRQFRDMKGSVDVDRLSREQFGRYVRACARMLARAHSQSEGAHMIAGYLGSDSPFAEAIAQWSTSYADVCESDYEALAAAARSGRFPVETGL